MKKVIIIRETVYQSWARDTVTFAMVASLCSIGWLLDITALQVVGGIMAMLWIVIYPTKHNNEMTIEEARAFLDGIDAEGR